MGPLSIEEVLAAEAAAIHDLTDPETKAIVDRLRDLATGQGLETRRADKDADTRSGDDENRLWVKNRKAFYCELGKLRRTALCFSGGGIRSATFCLGVIQALARYGLTKKPATVGQVAPLPFDLEADANNSLLSRFHYLSTVSGGGYIGSWLSAWRHHDDFPTVWQNLSTRPDGPDVEPPEISWLRSYSNYLTPKTGLFSLDTWTGVAIYLRNLLLNWLVIVPALAVVLLILKILITVSVGVARYDYAWWPHLITFVVGAVLLVTAQAFTTAHRPTRRLPPGGDPCKDPLNITQSIYLRRDFLWSFFSAVFVTSTFTSAVGVELAGSVTTFPAILVGAIIGALIFAAGWLAGNPTYWRCRDFLMWTASGLVYGGFIGLGAHLFTLMDPYSDHGELSLWLILIPVIFGVPWVLLAQLFADMVFVGLSSKEVNSDADREWLGRAAGVSVIATIVWTSTTFISFAGGYFLIDYLYDQVVAPYILGLGGITGAITAWIGKLGAPGPKAAADQKDGQSLWAKVGLLIAGPLFAAVLIVATSVILDVLLLGESLMRRLTALSWSYSQILLWLVIGLVAAFALAWVASRNVNINRFSIHALYRNRLMRAYLGASRQQRCPDEFTGFDADDNIPAHALWPPQRFEITKQNTYCLFHVVNITLNVVKTARLAWQQRKAESFTVSPLHCGAAFKGYRPSIEYAGPRKPFGISLGTAMAISGAAANPNMGYNSSPSITLLLALFNVRLGWWLGNPGKEGNKTYKEEGPLTAIRPLTEETFGLTTDTKPWVNLSDGGHFENLGIYEMVRRRCRFILAVDAGCDPDFAFEDLGNAVRKIYIDLGIRVHFDDLDKLKNRPSAEALSTAGGSIPYYTIGTIGYGAADGDCEDGVILYVKPAYHGTSRVEGAGVRSYAVANPSFPHEPTADQWFSESQFESYRSLALDICGTFMDETKALPDLPGQVTLGQYLKTFPDTARS